MGPTLNFEHALGDTVQTKVGVKGIVTSLCVDNGGFVYAVEWLNDSGEVKSRWFRPNELSNTG